VPDFVPAIVIFSVLVPIVAIVLIFIFVARARSAHKRRTASNIQNLAAVGVVAPAIITAARQTVISVNNQPKCQFELQITPAEEPPFAASVIQVISLLDISRYHVGAAVTVRYNPQDRTQIAIMADPV